MTNIDNRNAISIAQISAYSPLLLLSLFVLRRHGLSGGIGFLFTTLFCVLRIVGAALNLATISNPTSTGLIIGAATCNGIGISPLFLATSGVYEQLLKHLDDLLSPHFIGLTVKIHSRLVELTAAVAVILALVGSVRAGNDFADTGRYVPQSLTKAGTALFILTFVALLDLTVFATGCAWQGMLQSRAPPLLRAAWASMPLLFVRLLYSCLGTFDTSTTEFNLLSGDVWIWLGMAVIEEILVVVMYLSAGLATPRDQRKQSL